MDIKVFAEPRLLIFAREGQPHMEEWKGLVIAEKQVLFEVTEFKYY